MAEFTKVANVTEIPEGSGRIFEVSGNQVAIWNVGGNFHAFQNVCPHRGGPVGEGEIEGTTITCPWHGWSFDVVTCEGTVNPAAKLTKYEVQIDGSDVKVAV